MSLPVTAIARVGVLTRDCRAAAAEYARFFGINDWRIADCAGRTADGREYAHRQAVGYANGVGFELIEPQSGPWADLLAAGGEGPSHVVVPTTDWSALATAQASGFPPYVDPWMPGVKTSMTASLARKALTNSVAACEPGLVPCCWRTSSRRASRVS